MSNLPPFDLRCQNEEEKEKGGGIAQDIIFLCVHCFHYYLLTQHQKSSYPNHTSDATVSLTLHGEKLSLLTGVGLCG